MGEIITCESGWVFDQQSNHRYTASNVPKGHSVGEREQSFGLAQIHLPAHPGVTKQQAIDPEFAVDFLARGLKTGKETQWSCYNIIAMR